jgi:nitrogen fixation NifU-like protein
MYREVILDHYRSPRGKNVLKTVDFTAGGHNPACGDEIEMSVEMDKEHGILKDVHIDCKGCAISVASGSMLAETVRGKKFDEVMRIAQAVKKLLKGESEVDDLPVDNEDLEALAGVRQFPVRIKCALLSWATLIEGIKSYSEGDGSDAKTSTEADA